MSTSYRPAGYHTVTPSITVRHGANALAFYKDALGASEVMRFELPGGVIAHAEIEIGGARVMLADEMPEWGNRGPESLGGTSGGLCVFVPDVDAAFATAVAAGAKVVRPVQDQFYGDRSGTLLDPFGHQWTLATHIEDVSPEEMQRRFAAMMGQSA
ncbi:Glyoxalase-like domain protein [Gemmata obscuriglobus]|uniref:VOC family protein n=1 Tax=Gemmata obscuriglobus TaxID=114 RepID=A0A2Z3HFT8_9BACT|nr:VOC family protein [Gemmata obscuriglobus]AWM41845.1 VOC family protein [Gemmata obscuriglobus]QEG32189.1 Glyoxalase-like domain protein [Gemmata obscuriglobus]VTS11542.1 Glyoxalase/bleomycin resistance protein/dioxygenase (Dioxygenase) OS=Ralstonia solanacearum CMR15 GN=CMR15_30802 PE=4 SV=1: Glyoxalase_2 [Gemmata obscuriglobus UQM 2246]